jgi:hypothetical protein
MQRGGCVQQKGSSKPEPANTQMEPTRPPSRAIVSPRRAAHLAR